MVRRRWLGMTMAGVVVGLGGCHAKPPVAEELRAAPWVKADMATPKGLIKTFYRAAAEGDGAMMRSLFYTPTPVSAAYGDDIAVVSVRAHALAGAIRARWPEAFGKNMLDAEHLRWFSDEFVESGKESLAELEFEENGDVAEKTAGNFGMSIVSELQAPIRRINGQWKLDLGGVPGYPKGAGELGAYVYIFCRCSVEYPELTLEVTAGKYASYNEFYAAFKERIAPHMEEGWKAMR